MKSLNDLKSLINAEVIRAITPIFIAAIGGAIGLAVLLSPGNVAKDAAFGLATTAIAGAAGLAQPTKDPNQKDE